MIKQNQYQPTYDTVANCKLKTAIDVACVSVHGLLRGSFITITHMYTNWVTQCVVGNTPMECSLISHRVLSWTENMILCEMRIVGNLFC